MRAKLLTLVAVIVSVIGLAPAATAAEDIPPPGCDTVVEPIFAGERVTAYCNYLPYPPSSYRVVAHCAAGGSFWYELGSIAEPGFSPSVAECRGLLLSTARVAGYHIEQR
ncbi:hypothetical protein [Actinocrispum wychmicini]|uniref:Uncharacterized protein n=1 Tax=Actinocrispum wychmicini TaxID=1213861 RepID=A0A4R2K0A8_9PSEU|nr:hypothetical protein [Actinocrispum wychmicini]TCO65704.1 hypothetical protein EV192_1011496 [Actinocrispum wychmicini]